jgi:hypothetical protein
VQLVLLLDFAASWNESWLAAYERANDRKWVFLLISTVVLFYTATLVVTVLLFGAHAAAAARAKLKD